MKRALVILLGAALLALALAAGVAVFLGATQGGTRFLAGQAERFLPLRLTGVSGALLREVRVGKLEYDLEGGRLTVNGLAASVELMPLLFENHLVVHSLSADSLVLESAGGTGAGGPAPLLELPYMPLRIDVESASIGRLTLPDLFPMRVGGSASWNEDALTLHDLNVVSDVIVGNVRGRIGTGRDPVIAAEANWSLPDRAWGGEGHIDGRVNDFALHHVLRGDVSVDAEGRGDLSNVAEPRIDVRVTAQDLEFGETAIRAINGQVSGTPSNLTADVTSVVSTPGVKPFHINLAGYGPVTGPLTLRSVTADALGGTQEAQGRVAWDEDVQLALGGTVSHVSLAGFREGIAGDFGSAFELQYRDGRLHLGVENLSGTLNGRPVSGRVMVTQLAEGWQLDPVRLTVGGNELEGNARLGESTVQMESKLRASALEALGLGLSGDVSGDLSLSGTWSRLNGRADLTSRRLAGFDAELDGSRLTASFANGVLQGSVAAGRAARHQLEVSDLKLDVQGPLQQVDWHLSWSNGAGNGTLRRLDDGVDLGIADAHMALLDQQWSLTKPTRVRLGGQRLALAPACIAGGGATACVDKLVYDDGRIETRGKLTRAPVALFRPWLPIRLGDDGFLEGHWTLAGTLDDLNGELDLAARQLSYVAEDGQQLVDLPDLETSGTVAGGVLQVRLAAVDKALSLTGNGRLTPMQPDGGLEGTIKVSASDLTPLKAFDQRIAEVAGSIQGSLAVSGTPVMPRLDGQIALTGGRLKVNDPDATLDDIDVKLGLDDSGTFQLQGDARLKNSTVRLNAAGSGLFTEALAFNASLKGQRLPVGTPDWEVTVTPDLALDYAKRRGRLHGRVEVPKAELRLSALPTSVPSPSEDVVVVGRETNGNGDQVTNRFRADVEVVLGKDVTLKALGLTATMEGALQARLDAYGRTTLRGTLNVTGGELSTQGQTLTIESGSVVYNGPVTRPYIDIRAVRTIDTVSPSVKVGLHISGDANNLSSSVFSEPAMSETRALGFLVLGHDIDEQSSATDSSRLAAAAINLGLSRSKNIASELMQVTGLDELSASAEASNSFDIIAGKRISKGLYVRYTYNTLAALGAVLVRYDLTRRWQLEAQSGEQSSMDILYTFGK